MAEVYAASTAPVGGVSKQVALKLIHPRYSRDEKLVSMLVAEAKLAVRLSHRNVVQVLDLGRHDDRYFIVMEYVDGCDLDQLMRTLRAQGRRFPVDLAVHVAVEICHALDYAHRRLDEHGRPLRIIHRDVSPQNVLVSAAGEVKLADFGVAKAADRTTDAEQGVIKGKYYYMSPEQARAAELDQRSDLFSVGVILWELLAGQMLHTETDVERLLSSVRSAVIPAPSTLAADVPAVLDALVAIATAHDPTDRFASAAEMADALLVYRERGQPAFLMPRLAELVREVRAAPAVATDTSAPIVPTTADHPVDEPDAGRISHPVFVEDALSGAGSLPLVVPGQASLPLRLLRPARLRPVDRRVHWLWALALVSLGVLGWSVQRRAVQRDGLEQGTAAAVERAVTGADPGRE